MSDVSVGLIGCGRIGKRHAEILSGQISGMKLAAVCDIDPQRAVAFSKQYNVPCLFTMENMGNLNLDILTIATPSGCHAKHAIALAGLCPILIVEKPIALTVSDADTMINHCRQIGTQLLVVKQNRFNFPVQRLREELATLGRLTIGTIRVRWCRHQDYYNDWHGTWALSGGVLANQAIHHIDLLQWMMGEVEEVFAYGATQMAQSEVEDSLVGILRFKSGAIGTVEATTTTRPSDIEGSLSILGEGGIVEIGGFAVNKIVRWQFVDKEKNLPPDYVRFCENPPDVYGFGHKRFYEHVLDVFLGKAQPLTDGKEAKKSVAICCAMYESMETGKPVRIGEPTPHCRMGKNG